MDATRQVVEMGNIQKHARQQYNGVYMRTPKNTVGAMPYSGRHEIVTYHIVFQEF